MPINYQQTYELIKKIGEGVKEKQKKREDFQAQTWELLQNLFF